MKTLSVILFSVFLGAFAVLSGCDSDGNSVAGIDRGGLRGVFGSITGFGSVIVNGEHYETDSAAIRVNGAPAAIGDLEVGYVVAIQANLPQSDSSSRAVTIEFAHIVIGPMSAVVAAENRITVLGQSVSVSDTTAYGPGINPASIDGLSALPVDTVLRVSGFNGTDGEVLATRIESGASGSGLEVTGIVADLNSSLQTFRIGGLTVNYGLANLQGFSDGQPQEGNRINVEGSLDSGGVLVASELELKEIKLEVDEGDEFEIEGLITAILSATRFSVSGVTVSIDDQTVFEHGDASMLDLNVRVEVEGRFEDDIFRAEEVEFRPNGSLRIEAGVDSVNPLSVLGIVVQTNSQTIFEDKSPAELRPFSLADIDPADPLRITGYESPTTPGVIIATGITRTEPLEGLKLRGIAENVSAPEFSILGVLVITDDDTDIEDNFFANAEGRLVEAHGSTVSGSFVADKVEFED